MKSILIICTLALGALATAFFNPYTQKGSTPAVSTSFAMGPAPVQMGMKAGATENQPPCSATGQPEELGLVHWSRDLEQSRISSLRYGKPLLILFQEVPGCSNCTRYGNTTLSHPLIVEAIEQHFIPVCIYNNKGGKDAEALKRFNEPAWNNPVVRIVSEEYQDLTPRISNFNSSAELLRAMVQYFDQASLGVPEYLSLLLEEMSAREAGLETATFSMYCFWTGEGTFGNLPGVIETESGYQDGKEVVKVQFNPSVTSRAELEKQTKPQHFSACAQNQGFRPDAEPKYYLAQTNYRFIPMTTLQACRVNSLIGEKKSPISLMSWTQIEMLKKVTREPNKNWKNMVGRKDLVKAWAEFE